MTKYYNAFGPYIKKQFGETVYKVNIDAGFTCPNRDGTVAYGGCIYCNNDSFRPASCKPDLSVGAQVENGISYLSKRYGAKKFIAYFQPFTNTYASVEELERVYGEALSHPHVVGIAIGTRSDSVDEEKIELLRSLSRQYFVLVEYGLQSIYDESLEYINRGHNYENFLHALELTRGKGIHIGAHIILGFPTETRDDMLTMSEEISSLPVEFLKIHQLQVIKDTLLAEIYNKKPFYVFEYDDYLDFLAAFIERLSSGIILQRLFATAPENILIAPKWKKSRQEIIRDIDKTFRKKNTFHGKEFKSAVRV